ncbi:MAG: CocE/NonD family hydrolase [Solirubrobacterales bacterium]|nr:CocE/NonD family hydrolase [Solirubrobacterales bacterium]
MCRRTWARRCRAVAGAAAATSVLVLLLPGADARASVIERGYLPLGDGTQLHYTLTLPSSSGRYPVVLKYDPYSAGAYSDQTWNASGYATLGVNFRGTGCSEGTFHPVRADIWGADGAQIVAWAAKQTWSDGNVGMIGYSFTGTSQFATAAYSGSALKAITPGNVFPDLYRDMVWPGGIYNSWISLWIAARNYSLGVGAIQQGATDLRCLGDLVGQVVPNETQSLDTSVHPNGDDAYWSRQPSTLMSKVHIPVLGCVGWQDTTVYSRAFSAFRDQLDPKTTWVVGGNGAHTDCPISRTRLVRFFDRYLRHRDDGWESTPHVVVVHEVTGQPGVREKLDDHAGAWQTSFQSWADLGSAIRPLSLYLRANGRLDLSSPAVPEAADSYRYPTPTTNTPADFGGKSAWANSKIQGGSRVYTTPKLAQDAEFLGSGSADLWVASTATDTDLQVTLSEVRPDGQEIYVENGWLRVSHRRLDGQASTALRPYPTYRGADVEPLVPGKPVLARLEILPFDHVFRAGSAIRLSVDAPGGYFAVVSTPATNTIYHQPGMESKIALGWLPGARAQAPRPACGTVLNQPCRTNITPLPEGVLTLPAVGGRAAAVTMRIGRVTGLSAARRGHSFRVSVWARAGAVHAARLVLRDAKGRRIGTSKAFRVGAQARRLVVRVSRRLRPGRRYTLSASGLATDGTRVRASARLRA